MRAPAAPAVGDPVVVDGTKYRIRLMGEHTARLRTSFGGQEAAIDPRTLSWDARAGLWRAERCTPTR